MYSISSLENSQYPQKTRLSPQNKPTSPREVFLSLHIGQLVFDSLQRINTILDEHSPTQEGIFSKYFLFKNAKISLLKDIKLRMHSLFREQEKKNYLLLSSEHHRTSLDSLLSLIELFTKKKYLPHEGQRTLLKEVKTVMEILESHSMISNDIDERRIELLKHFVSTHSLEIITTYAEHIEEEYKKIKKLTDAAFSFPQENPSFFDHKAIQEKFFLVAEQEKLVTTLKQQMKLLLENMHLNIPNEEWQKLQTHILHLH